VSAVPDSAVSHAALIGFAPTRKQQNDYNGVTVTSLKSQPTIAPCPPMN